MEVFIDIFLTLDHDDNGSVDKVELLNFCEQQHLEKSMVDVWMNNFDSNKDGKVTLGEFCNYFGLRPQEMIKEVEERRQIKDGLNPVFPSTIEMVNSKMSKIKQADITNKFVELLGQEIDDKKIEDVKNEFKRFLDEKYGRIWQVIIFDGSSWMNVTHEPIYSLQFHYKNYTVVVWRIPSDK